MRPFRIRRLEDESKEVFLIGRIDYTDAFKKSRRTTFRYSVGGELGYDKHMSACKQGNATEESNPAST